MARHTIIEKLGRELSGEFPIRRESQVVYLLAEIRKIIEHERERDRNCYEVLELFCHWVLHIAIDRRTNADRIRLFLRAFDLRDGMEIEDFLNTEFYNNIMQLEAFRRALEEFLAGDYVAPNLIPGKYRVVAEQVGFKKFVAEDVQLVGTADYRVDIRLEVGAVTESVTVSGGAQLIETEKATFSHSRRSRYRRVA